MDERALYHETCRYVERIQEIFDQTLSVEQWERTVEAIMKEMRFLVRHSHSAFEQPTGEAK